MLREIVRAAIGEPCGSYIGTRVHTGFSCQALETSGLDVEALCNRACLESVGPDRRSR